MKKAIILICALLFSSVVVAQSLEDIKWYTEDYPPYNFTKDNKLQGIAVETLIVMLKRAGLNKTVSDISVVPWARGLKLATTKAGTCLFSTTKTFQREKELGFKFVYPIRMLSTEGSDNQIIASKASKVKINSLSDLNKYKIGVVNQDIGQGLVKEAKVEDKNIDLSRNGTMLLKKMDKGRIPLISYSYASALKIMKEEGIDPNKYEVVYSFPPLPMGYAFHKDTPPALIKKLQTILDKLNSDGTTDAILKKYAK